MPTVVIADDSPTLRRIVGTVLERAGFTVVAAEDGVEAVQQVFRYQPDAVVLDVQMPRVSGYVAARMLKDDWQTAEIPILLLTSLDAASDRYWADHVGADRFLSKDFEAPQLVEAVQEVLKAAEAERGGRPSLRPDPAELTDDEVMGRVSDLLDRKLFEASVAAEVTGIAADVHGFEETVATVLGVIGRVVDYDLASVLMLDSRAAYMAVARATSHAQYGEFIQAVADAATQVTGSPMMVQDLIPRIADPAGDLGQEEEGTMSTFLSMPLRVGGRIIGVLALSSAQKNAFGETALSTLKLIASPAGIVIANASNTTHSSHPAHPAL